MTKNFGFANGWTKEPDLVGNCKHHKHTLQIRQIRPGVKEYSCNICGYKYQIDSGD